MGFSMFLLAQLLIVLIFRYSNAQQSILRSVSRAGFDGERYLSMLTIATVMVTVLAYTLLPLYVALVGGDFVAKEVEDGTLRMILCRPISRVRLLCVKWLAGFVFACVLVLSLGAFALMFCALWFPTTGGLFTVIPGQGLAVYEMADGLKHYALAHLFLVAKASTILSLAFMFSCFDMKPAAATVLALS
jgi:ABC-2 type transport system permease protein